MLVVPTRKWVRSRGQTALARLRIGHTRLTHSYLMSGEYQPYCDDCLMPLIIRHLLVDCPSLLELRQRFLFIVFFLFSVVFSVVFFVFSHLSLVFYGLCSIPCDPTGRSTTVAV